MNSQTHHGQYLEALYLKLGKSKEEAAAIMGYAPAYLSRYYKQEIIPAKILTAAAQAFGLDVSDFYLSPKDFDAKLAAMAPPPPSREEALNALREELREKKKEVESWKDKYLRLLEEYNLHLKDKKA